MNSTVVNPTILEKIFSSMSNGVIVVDQHQKIVVVNPSAQKLLNINKDDPYIGKDISQFIPNTQIPEVLSHRKNSVGAQMTISGVQCMVNRTPFYQDNQLIGVVCEIQDISQMEHYQSLFKKMEKIIEFSTDGIYVVDKDGKTLFVNSAYEEITGFNRNELIGNHMEYLMNKGYFDQSVSLLVLEEKKQISILQKIDKKKDVIVTGNPVLDDSNEIQMVVTSVRDITHLNEINDELKRAKTFSEMNQNRYTFSPEGSDEKIIFQSSQMKNIMDKVKQIAPYPSSVLLSGPSGAGKEVIANLIHHESNRKDMPFIKVNCGAIPEHLLESELFGYEKGAFTGARQEGKIGLLELAHKGTVLLDEVGELPLALQVKLLRSIQEKQIQKLGSNKVKQLDIRIISATNKNLKQLVNQGKFREDLYYRLQVVDIYIPPLHERQEDIEFLIDYFFSHFCRLYNIKKRLSPETKTILQNYHWPGNVRELKNLVESMIVSVPSLTIESIDLPPHIGMDHDKESLLTLKQRVEQFEKKIIRDALQSKTSIRKTAQSLGIDHSTLVKKIKKWNLKTQ
ncbi:sigma 54-interacting transcriptional regulator [Bacillota bacterium Lsc_1132]